MGFVLGKNRLVRFGFVVLVLCEDIGGEKKRFVRFFMLVLSWKRIVIGCE